MMTLRWESFTWPYVAVEIFLTDRRSAFLAFPDRRTAREAAARIAASRPGVMLMDRRRKLEAGPAAHSSTFPRSAINSQAFFVGLVGWLGWLQ